MFLHGKYPILVVTLIDVNSPLQFEKVRRSLFQQIEDIYIVFLQLI